MNAVLNLVLIPFFGIAGAAYATLVAYAIGLIQSGYLGAKVFFLPFPWNDFFRIVFCVTSTSVIMASFNNWMDLWKLMIQALIAGIVYFLMLFLLNVGGLRRHLLSRYS